VITTHTLDCLCNAVGDQPSVGQQISSGGCPPSLFAAAPPGFHFVIGIGCYLRGDDRRHKHRERDTIYRYIQVKIAQERVHGTVIRSDHRWFVFWIYVKKQIDKGRPAWVAPKGQSAYHSADHLGAPADGAFDMAVLNDLDRFHLVMDTIDRVPRIGEKGVYLKQQLKDKLIEHKQYIDKHGQDLPEIRNWTWGNPT
jgi:XFP C-terminal domain